MAMSSGSSAMATGKWGNVHLANEGLTLLSIAMAVDDAHLGECGSLTAWEHAAVVWVGGQDFRLHFSWGQQTSLEWFEDKLAELPNVVSGKDANAGAAAGASTVERQARSLIVQLGYDVAKMVPLPAIADSKIDLSAFRRLKSLSSVPLPVGWLAKLATKMAIAHPGVADDVVQWLYTMLQLDSKLTIQAAAVLSTADGDSATWDEIVAHIGANLRCDEAFAATRLESARTKRARAARPAGSAFAEGWTALEYAAAYAAMIGVIDALGAGGAAAATAAPAVNAAATAVAVDKFWFAAAKILRSWHKLEIDRDDSESYLKNLVGASLRDIARLRDESPTAMALASLQAGARHATPDEIIQHTMLLARTGVPAGSLPSATGAAAAATAAVPAAAAAATAPMMLSLDQKSIDALTNKKRGSRGASASDPPSDGDPLVVGKATAAINNSRYVQVEDSPVFMRVEPELLAALTAVREKGADPAAIFDGLSSDAKWMLGRQVHQQDKVNEPRLSPLTELQAQFAKGAIKALTEWYKDHDKRMFSADAAEARSNGLKAVFAAMRRSDLEKGGPHGLSPWGPLDTLWTFIKSKFSEEGSAEAVQLRNEWNAILRRWALEMEAQAGSCTGWVEGAEVIIDTLRYKAKSDAGIQWSEQQKTFYVGVLFHAWADHDKLWQAAPEKVERKTVKEIDDGKFMRATKKELHQMTPANAPKEMPYCELTLGTTSSSASRQRAKSAGSASDAEDGDGAGSASGWESDGAAKKRPPKKAKQAPAKGQAPAQDSLASLVNSVKKLHDKVSSNSAAVAKLGGKGGGDGGGGWQSKNSVLGANGAGAGSGANTGGLSALFVPWGKESEVQFAGVDTVKCLAAQEHVNSPKYSGCLKNCCIYALIGEHGCSAGGGLGAMGGCGNQHFSSDTDKESVPRELKKVLKLDYVPSIQHQWFQRGVIGGHGAHSSPGRGGKGAGKGGGRGGSGGGGKGGGRGKGGK